MAASRARRDKRGRKEGGVGQARGRVLSGTVAAKFTGSGSRHGRRSGATERRATGVRPQGRDVRSSAASARGTSSNSAASSSKLTGDDRATILGAQLWMAGKLRSDQHEQARALWAAKRKQAFEANRRHTRGQIELFSGYSLPAERNRPRSRHGGYRASGRASGADCCGRDRRGRYRQAVRCGGWWGSRG